MTRRKNIYIYMETRVIVKFVGTKADVKLAFRMDSYVGGKQNNVSTLREGGGGSALIQKSGKIDVGRGRGEGYRGRLEKSNGFWGGKQGRAACSSGYLVTLVGARYLNGHPRFV